MRVEEEVVVEVVVWVRVRVLLMPVMVEVICGCRMCVCCSGTCAM